MPSRWPRLVVAWTVMVVVMSAAGVFALGARTIETDSGSIDAFHRPTPVTAMPELEVSAKAVTSTPIGGLARASEATLPATTTSTTTVPEPRSVTMAFTGDIIPHNRVIRLAATYGDEKGTEYDFGPMFEQVESTIAGADLAICHLETPIRADRRPSGFPSFNAPADLASALAEAGYDGCSTASNHAYDQGAEGVALTLDALDAAGVGHSGTARTAEERDVPVLYPTESGVVVAHISATEQLNGARLPPDSPFLVRRIDAELILADAAAARAAGADVVVVSLHWGVEGRVKPTPFQEQTARTLLDSADVDLIVGHHAHTVQPIDRINDKFVIYGLGNFLTNQLASCCGTGSQDGVIMQVTMSEEMYGARFQTTDITWVPTRVDRSTMKIVDVEAALADTDVDGYLRTTLENSMNRTGDILISLYLLDTERPNELVEDR